MNTFMTDATFQALVQVRATLASGEYASQVAGIFVPWCGSKLRNDGGLYYVGIGTDGDFYNDQKQSLKDCIGYSEDICINCHDRNGTPFWRYLDRLTKAFFAEPFFQSTQWGWSNLLKIGYAVGSPQTWPKKFVTAQIEICKRALNEELFRVRRSVVFFASAQDYEILQEATSGLKFTEHSNWITDFEDDGIHYIWNAKLQNLYIRGYHPGHAQRKRFFDRQLYRTVDLAVDHLGWAYQSWAAHRLMRSPSSTLSQTLDC